MSESVVIAGCGPGSPDLLTPAAIEAARSADVLLGAGRLLDLFPLATAARTASSNPGAILKAAAAARAAGRRVVVLVSGDPGLCSLARLVIRRFGPGHCRIIPGISSVQLAFARLGLDWTGARILSAHAGRPVVAPASLRAEPCLAVLTGHEAARPWLHALLEALRDTHRAFWCQNLSLPDELVLELGEIETWEPPSGVLGVLVLVLR